ncbi:transposable element Tc1 transposase [Trichonephila clavipes]|nr:transposable element Tc1 transposase [Trichonephila clavipes]
MRANSTCLEVMAAEKSGKKTQNEPQEFDANCETRRRYGMVWGAMAATGVGNLVFIDGNMNKFGYLKILQSNLHPSVQKLGLGSNFVFQQDNDPKHTAKIVKEWLLYRTP